MEVVLQQVVALETDRVVHLVSTAVEVERRDQLRPVVPPRDLLCFRLPSWEWRCWWHASLSNYRSIGPEWLAASVKLASDVKLVHLFGISSSLSPLNEDRSIPLSFLLCGTRSFSFLQSSSNLNNLLFKSYILQFPDCHSGRAGRGPDSSRSIASKIVWIVRNFPITCQRVDGRLFSRIDCPKRCSPERRLPFNYSILGNSKLTFWRHFRWSRERQPA